MTPGAAASRLQIARESIAASAQAVGATLGLDLVFTPSVYPDQVVREVRDMESMALLMAAVCDKVCGVEAVENPDIPVEPKIEPEAEPDPEAGSEVEAEPEAKATDDVKARRRRK